jgi:phosphoenolpyruvate---glycerone phosphotransferase subunit DhaL
MTTETSMGEQTIRAWLGEAEREIKANADHLSQLDAALGDGDHGTNMSRGFDAVGQALAAQHEGTPPGQLLTVAGKTFVSVIGGASGALWGLAFRRAGRALGDADRFDGPALADALDAAVGGIVELGEAKPGDSTMLDALMPATAALREALDAGRPLEQALAAAADAARAGADATADMQARKGRASYLGERSIGHQDPSANSAAILLAALHHAVAQAG